MKLRTPRDATAGVTLVEILVVLSIIAIVTGAAMLRLGIGRGADDLSATAIGLALILTAASDQALLTGQDQRLDIGPEGYRLSPASGPATPWHPLPALAEPTSASFVLAADGTSAPFHLHLTSGQSTTTVDFDGLRASVGASP